MININPNARKIFSVPLNPKLNEKQFEEFFYFCQRNKDWIVDVYFTCRIPPFKQDAMGDVFILEQDNYALVETALEIQKHLGIYVSATFNNIQVPPTQTNLDTFIINFKKIYDAGVRIATIPHTHWLATGQIQTAFPELYIKNTILRDVRTATDVVNLAKAGFNYINLDRDLMRDRAALLRLKEAKEWIKTNLNRNVDFSMLVNEGCLGECPVMNEHYEYNNTRSQNLPQYFNDPISRVSCPKWDVDDPAVALKTANLSPWKSDWDEYLNELGIDYFKMHGREDISRLYETMTLIDRYVNNEYIVFPEFTQWVEETGLTGKPIDLWREKIKSCKFECWECQYCDKIYEKRADLHYSDLVKHTADSILKSGIPIIKNNIQGLTSPRVQTLLNLLAQGVGSYLEIGSYLGATACAVLENNSINAIFVDNWKDDIQPNSNQIVLSKNNKEEFENNIDRYKGMSNITVLDCDLFDANTAPIKNSVQLFFYDGPHDYETTYNAIVYYYSTFTNEAILVIDDANWEGVVDASINAINDCGAKITYQKLMLNSEENSREWWNGLLVMVINK